ncbi:MAG: hypothetical protein U5K00_07850 [Melioribacteraceae bacterium]|nr:hypothetical protein [Melioribacteraceae bacterium]
MNAGYHEFKFGSQKLASGVYFYRINVEGKFISTKKMILVK